MIVMELEQTQTLESLDSRSFRFLLVEIRTWKVRGRIPFAMDLAF